MGAAVFKGTQRALTVARDHDRHRAGRRAEIAVWLRQLGFQTEEAPGGAAEDALLLVLVEVAIGIDPIRHPRDALGRPAALARRHGGLPLLIAVSHLPP